MADENDSHWWAQDATVARGARRRRVQQRNEQQQEQREGVLRPPSVASTATTAAGADESWDVGQRMVIYQDAQLRVILQRQMFVSQRRWAEHDHNYRVQFEWLSAHRSEGISMLRCDQLLRRVLQTALEQVRHYAPANSLSSVGLITLVDNEHHYQFHTGGMDLNDVGNVVTVVMDKVMRTLESHESFNLTSGFYIYIKVLSAIRLQQEGGGGGRATSSSSSVPSWVAGGQGGGDEDDDDTPMTQQALRLSSTLPPSPRGQREYGRRRRPCSASVPVPSKLFPGRCLLVAFTYARLHRLHLHHVFRGDDLFVSESRRYKSIAKLNGFLVKVQRQCGGGGGRGGPQDSVDASAIVIPEDLRPSFETLSCETKKVEEHVRHCWHAESRRYDVHATVEALSRHFGVQISIYNMFGLIRRKYRYPASYDPALVPVHLLDEAFFAEDTNKDGLSVSHMSVLLNPQAYFLKLGGIPCPRCDHRMTYPSRHRCLPKHTCFACRRWLPSQGQFIDSSTRRLYCFAKDDGASTQRCVRCNVRCRSSDCYRMHANQRRHRLCEKGFYCMKCSHYARGSCTEEARRNHVCFVRKCHVCQEEIVAEEGDSHQCSMSKETCQKRLPRLAIYDFESYTTDGISDCLDCYQRERDFCAQAQRAASTTTGKERAFARIKKLDGSDGMDQCVRCPRHRGCAWSESEHRVNYAVLYYEKVERGRFSSIEFADPALHHEDDGRRRDDVVVHAYLPPSLASFADVNRVVLDDTPLEEDRRQRSKQKQPGRRRPDASSKGLPKSSKNDSFPRVQDDDDRREEEEKNVLDKFCDFILRPAFRDYVFLAHNGGRYDVALILQCLLKRNITPQMVSKDMKILSLHVEELNIRFLDSINYVLGSLASLAKTFQLDRDKGFFPHLFNRPENYAYEGVCPDADYFFAFTDARETVEEKKAFVQRHRRLEGATWNFAREIARYCHLDVWLLTHIVCRYVKDNLTLQERMAQMHEHQCHLFRLTPADDPESRLKACNYCRTRHRRGRIDILHPFGAPYMTLSSYVYGSCRYFFMNAFPMFAITDEHATCSVKSSLFEMEVALFFHHAHPECLVESKFTSAKPRHYYPYVVDVALTPPNEAHPTTVVHALGCYYHMHDPERCGYFRRRGKKIPKMNYMNETVESCRRRQNAMQEFLSKRCHITRQICIWECQWQRWKKKQQTEDDAEEEEEEEEEEKGHSIRRLRERVQTFWRDKRRELSLRPSTRLTPREAVRGGLVETFGLVWDAAAATTTAAVEQQSQLHYVDVNSLYPATNFAEENAYPSGKATLLVNPTTLANVTFDVARRGVFYEGKQIWGLAQASLVPPTLQTCPFLIEKLAMGGTVKNVLSLCHTCAAQNSTRPCRHDTYQRAITGVYTLDELVYAKSVGYVVMHVYEILYYTQRSPLFRDYLRLLAKEKIRYEGFPDACRTERDRETFCAKVSAHLNVQVNVEDMERNASMRYLAKISSNALLGKIGQNADKTTTVFISNQHDLNEALLRPDYCVKSAINLTDHVMQLQMRPHSRLRRISRRANVVAAAHTTAWARIYMHRHLLRLQQRGCVIYYMDTDSFILSTPPASPRLDLLLPMDDVLYGYFKDECEGKRIVGFASLAPKFYSLRLIDAAGRVEEVIKLRGFFLRQSRHDTLAVTHALFSEYAQSRAQSRPRCHVLGQFTIRTRKKDGQVVSHLNSKMIRNDCFSKRVLVIDATADCHDDDDDDPSPAAASTTTVEEEEAIMTMTLPFGYSRYMLRSLLFCHDDDDDDEPSRRRRLPRS